MSLLKPRFPRVNRSHPLSRGLKAAFPFFEGGGDSRLFDIVGSNHGTFVDAPSWKVSSPYGAALSFDGSNDAVSLPSILSPDDTEFSVAVLCKADNTSSEYRVFSYNNDGVFTLIRLNAGSAGEVQFFIQNGSGSTNSVTTTDFTITEYILIVGTAVEGGNMELYVQGVSQGTAAVPGFDDLDTSLGRYIGANRSADSNFLPGEVAGVWMWNRATSSGEVKQFSIDPWALFTPPSIMGFAAEFVATPMGEQDVTGQIDILGDISSTATKSFNRGDGFNIRVELSGGITKDFRNVQTFQGAIGIVADLDGVVSAQFTQERSGQIDIVAEFNSPVTFEQIRAGQIDAIVDMVAKKSEGETPVTDQDIGQAIGFVVPYIEYGAVAPVPPRGRRQ